MLYETKDLKENQISKYFGLVETGKNIKQIADELEVDILCLENLNKIKLNQRVSTAKIKNFKTNLQ